LSLLISDESGVIEFASFRTNGCGYAVAASDVLCGWLDGKELTDLHGLGALELSQVISNELDNFPAGRQHCAEIVFDALRRVMAVYRQRRIAEFQGEKALICTCFGISEDSIVNVIAREGFTEVDEVADACRAGSGCGSCRMLIQELIDTVSIDRG
jgi:NifU-like protein